MNTGFFGSHETPDHADAPKSYIDRLASGLTYHELCLDTYLHWANNVVETHQNRCQLAYLPLDMSISNQMDAYLTYSETEQESPNESTYKTFHSLFRRQLNERGLSKEESTDICKCIIANNQRRWHHKPIQRSLSPSHSSLPV